MKKSFGMLVLFVCTAFYTCPVFAASVEPRIGKEIIVGEAGLKMRIFRDASSTVMPALDRMTGDLAGKKTELVDMRSAWCHAQTKAFYNGESGSLAVLMPSLPVPEDGDGMGIGVVPETAFLKWASEKTSDKPPADIKSWLKFYFQEDFEKTETKFREGRNVSVSLYEPSDLKSACVYVMIVADRISGRVVLLVFNFPQGVDTKKIKRFLSSAAETVVFTKQTASEVREIEVKTRGKTSSGPSSVRSENYKASRDAVIRNITGADSWWYAETENYILVSNIKKRRDAQVIAEESEKIRSLFNANMPPSVPMDDVSVIRVFGDRDEYNRYLGEGYEWTAGVWIPMKKELVFFLEGDSRSKKQSRENVTGILYHELFHQYCFYSSGMMGAAPWFNEGLAQLFEDVKFNAAGKYSYDVPSDLVQRKVKNVLSSKYVNVENIIGLDHEMFNEERDYSYDATWLLMVFLVKHCPVKPELSAFSSIPGRYFTTLAETKDENKAFSAAWKDVDMKRISREFREFLSNRSNVSRAVSSKNTFGTADKKP